jgi:hypothetical protein
MTHQFDAGIAEIYGVEIAIMVQNFAFWIAKNKANNRNFYEGKTWTYNTIKAFNELFPYWSESQIRRILKKMEAEGILLTGNFNEVKYDRTIWYTFTNAFYEKHKCILQNRQMEVTKPSNGSDETVTPIPDKLPVILPDSLSSLKNKPNYQSFLDLYNKVCPSLPKAIKVNDKRKGLINAVIKEFGEDAVKEALLKVESCPHLVGKNDRGWRADFDWLINKNNLLKVIEGRYDQRKKLKEGDDGYYDNDRTW